jgi:phage-related protein
MARPTISQRIALVGSEEVKRAFAELGKAGEEAFSQLQRSSSGLRQSFQQVSGAIQRFSRDEAAIQNLGRAADQVRTSFGDTGTAVAGFVRTVAGVGLAAVGSVAGIAALGRSVLNKATAASSAATLARRNIQLESSERTNAVQAALQHESAVKALDKQFVEGAIDVTQYSKGLQDLTERQREQEQQSRIMRAVREAEADEQASAQAELQRRQAMEQLQARLGGQLTSSLIQLGTAAVQVRQEFIQTFGPAVASLVDGVTSFIERNRGALTQLFDDIRRQFAALGGDAEVSTVLQALLDVAREAASMITGALIPAFQTFMGLLNGVASMINAAFTEVTGKQILMAGIILKLAGVFGIVTGAIQSAFAAISLLVALFGPWGLAIAGVIAALAVLAAAVDWQSLLAAAKATVEGITAAFRSIPDRVVGFFTALGQQLVNLWNGMVETATAAWNGFGQFFANLSGTIAAMASSIVEGITPAFASAVESMVSAFQRMYQSIAGFFDGLLAKARDLASAVASAFGGLPEAAGGGVISRAGGGPVRGPGTSTSDSILAWLSNNEFVHRAKAVRYYGLQVMHALNDMRVPRDALSAAINGFSAGGLASRLAMPMLAPIPALASGGLPSANSSGRPVILNIGNESFSLWADDRATADRLVRFATRKQTARAGRMPGYFGSGR